LLLFLVAGTFAHQAKAQTCGANAQSTVVTDRPQITNSSVVVTCGSVQFENGFQDTGNGGQRTFDLPETLVRVGIAKKTELRFETPNYLNNDATAFGFANGFSDLGLGFKQQLGPWYGFDLSLIPSVSFPTGENLISSHRYDATLQLPWSRPLSKNWTLAGQFPVIWPTEAGRHNLTGQSSMYFDRSLASRWDAYVEYSGAFPSAAVPGTQLASAPHTSFRRINNSIFIADSVFRLRCPTIPLALVTLSASRPFDPDDVATGPCAEKPRSPESWPGRSLRRVTAGQHWKLRWLTLFRSIAATYGRADSLLFIPGSRFGINFGRYFRRDGPWHKSRCARVDRQTTGAGHRGTVHEVAEGPTKIGPGVTELGLVRLSN
jgi:hypothetical protein